MRVYWIWYWGFMMYAPYPFMMLTQISALVIVLPLMIRTEPVFAFNAPVVLFLSWQIIFVSTFWPKLCFTTFHSALQTVTLSFICVFDGSHDASFQLFPTETFHKIGTASWGKD